MGAIVELKWKAIRDFDKIMIRLEKGYREDLKGILNIISFIDSYPYLENNNQIAKNLLHG